MEKLPRPDLGPKVVFETPHYRVIVGRLSGPADLPEELRIKFIVQDKTSGVIYGTAPHLGQAKIAAIEAEGILLHANEIATEVAARGFQPLEQTNGDSPPKFVQ